MPHRRRILCRCFPVDADVGSRWHSGRCRRRCPLSIALCQMNRSTKSMASGRNPMKASVEFRPLVPWHRTLTGCGARRPPCPDRPPVGIAPGRMAGIKPQRTYAAHTWALRLHGLARSSLTHGMRAGQGAGTTADGHKDATLSAPDANPLQSGRRIQSMISPIGTARSLSRSIRW